MIAATRAPNMVVRIILQALKPAIRTSRKSLRPKHLLHRPQPLLPDVSLRMILIKYLVRRHIFKQAATPPRKVVVPFLSDVFTTSVAQVSLTLRAHHVTTPTVFFNGHAAVGAAHGCLL